MMNEWGVPPVELHSLLYQYAKQLADKGEYLPALAVAGGFTFEDQIFKGLALGAPFVKLVGMARAPDRRGHGRQDHRPGDRRGRSCRSTSSGSATPRTRSSSPPPTLRKELGNEEFEKLPTGAIGLYTYYERLAQGLRQLMAGSRKFALEHISRDDLAALTHEAADVTGITYVMDVDKEACAKIMNA